MNAKDRRTQQKDALKATILAAARDMFLRDEAGRISMRRLAEKIDYSIGTIYLHYPSKDALLNALVEESFAKLSQALRKTRRQDPVETLRAGLKAYVRFGLRYPNHYRFAFMRRPKPGPYQTHDAFEYLRECVRRCIEAGRFRQVDAETATEMAKLFLELIVAPSFSQEALAILTSFRPDIIITDLAMKPLNGIDFVRLLRQS